MKTKDDLIAKLKDELIPLIDSKDSIIPERYKQLRDKLESEITSIEQQLAEQKEKLTSTNKYCLCSLPDREPGFDYCMTCHKHVSPQRMELLTREIEITNEQKEEQTPYLCCGIYKIENEQKSNEKYFSDPDGKGWPDLEDDCAPD